MNEKNEEKGRLCDACGKKIRADENGNTSYNISDAGVLCDACEKKRHIRKLEETFDEPLHRGKF
jgi:CRISPR/Cas system-associated protein Cas10 (large subunit of type III CRISPR-Cas system)